MVDNKSDARDGGYVIDEPGGVVSVPTEDRTSSLPLVSTATQPTQHGIPSSQSPVPEATDTVTSQNEPRDPQVASLRSIFPDYDEAILQSVLESVGGDQDRAIDLLLAMNDPDFRSEAMPPTQELQMTQEDLDEQFARQLMLEEQQQVQQQQQHRYRSSRVRGQQSQQQRQQIGSPVGNKDTMSEIQEQVNKYTEIGKKNLTALVSKVKAKIQEFDKSDTGVGASGVQSTRSGVENPSYHDRQSASLPTNYQSYQGHGGMYNHSSTALTASQPVEFSSSNQFTSLTLSEESEKKLMQSSVPVQGYEVEPIPPSTSDAIATSSTPIAPQTSTPIPSRSPNPANPIDGGKLGLLPKRPISLIRDPPGTRPPTQKRDSDSDSLEYAENPFDDDRK